MRLPSFALGILLDGAVLGRTKPVNRAIVFAHDTDHGDLREARDANNAAG